MAAGIAVVLPLSVAAEEAAARNLRASFAKIAHLADSADSGAFVELVKAIDDAYPGGDISRAVFPFARSLESVMGGQADFHIPMLRNPKADVAALPYRFVSERLGVVEFVLYSHVEHPISAERIYEKLHTAEQFPYVIEVIRGTSTDLAGFPVQYANSLEQGMQRVAARRIDAFLTPQEEGDEFLRKRKLKNVHRARYMGFDDVIVIPKGPAGDATEAVLAATIQSLKSSGRWDALYHQVHRPYESWQPAAQGW